MIDNNLVQHIIQVAINAGRAILDIYETSDFGVEIKSDNSPLTLADKAAHEVIMQGLNETEYPVLSEEGAKTPYEERKHWKRFWMVDPLDGTKEFIKKNGEFTVNIALIEKGEPIFGVVYAPVLKELFYGGKGIGAYKVVFDDDFNLSFLEKPVLSVMSSGVETKTEVEVADGGGRRIECVHPIDKLTVVASRSHLNDETIAFIEEAKKEYNETDFISKGSSLKLVLVAEGKAHLYPRYAPTMEWDTAAGHAVALAAGAKVTKVDGTPLVYNKENLLNPYFIVSSKLKV